MPESAIHMKMVRRLKEWVVKNYEKNEKMFIWADTPKSRSSKLPIRIEGFVPDVYAKILSKPKEIIGEAKTYSDLDTRHSERQLTAFLRYCARNQDNILVIAVPWDLVRYTRSLIKYWKKRFQVGNVKIVVLEELGN